MRRSIVCCCALGLACASGASGDVVWNEAVNGDISGNRLFPTHITLHDGANSVIATMHQGDLEYLCVTIPAGYQFTGLIEAAWQGTDQTGFMAVQAGSIFTEPSNTQDVRNFLGYSHWGPGSFPIGTDLLQLLGWGGGAIGFTAPLPEGDYTFWIQDINPPLVTWQLDFVTVAPAPGAAAAVGAAAFGMAVRRRRR